MGEPTQAAQGSMSNGLAWNGSIVAMAPHSTVQTWWDWSFGLWKAAPIPFGNLAARAFGPTRPEGGPFVWGIGFSEDPSDSSWETEGWRYKWHPAFGDNSGWSLGKDFPGGSIREVWEGDLWFVAAERRNQWKLRCKARDCLRGLGLAERVLSGHPCLRASPKLIIAQWRQEKGDHRIWGESSILQGAVGHQVAWVPVFLVSFKDKAKVPSSRPTTSTLLKKPRMRFQRVRKPSCFLTKVIWLTRPLMCSQRKMMKMLRSYCSLRRTWSTCCRRTMRCQCWWQPMSRPEKGSVKRADTGVFGPLVVAKVEKATPKESPKVVERDQSR